MKKFTVIVLALAVLLAPSCKNQNKQKAPKAAEKKELSQKEKYITEELKLNLDKFLESTKKLKNIPFEKGKSGDVALNEKDKMVKPDYLLNPADAANMLTLNQKYRAAAMYKVDQLVATIYEMPVADEYQAALAKLAADINDPAFKAFSDAGYSFTSDEINTFLKDEYDSGRASYFWSTVAASCVEQIYVFTQNTERFAQMFDDQTAADVTYNFILLHEGITSLIEFYPEMADLNSVLDPLYVINAISVDQLKSQLTELKGDITKAREALLK